MNAELKLKIEQSIPRMTADEIRNKITTFMSEHGVDFENTHMILERTVYIESPLAELGVNGYTAHRHSLLLPPSATDIVAVKGTEAYTRLNETGLWRHGWYRWTAKLPVWEFDTIVFEPRNA